MKDELQERVSSLRRSVLLKSPLFSAVDGTLRSALAAAALTQSIVDYKVHDLIFSSVRRRKYYYAACWLGRRRVARAARPYCASLEDTESAALRDVHQRTAKRILRLCWWHGGIYTKFGQYLSTMGHILPPEVTEPLGVLTDRAHSVAWKEIVRVIEEDFGPGATQKLFLHVDAQPVASASLAQVHKAVRRKDRRLVALKLQYPHLEVQTSGDLWTLQMMARVVARVFPRCDFNWIIPEFQQNHTHEMDFRQEAFNSDRVRRLLSHMPDVYVPQVFWDMTSRRCLAMEFVDGIKVTDSAALEKKGINRQAIGKITTKIFGSLIFRHGFIHCDPHPGNLLARLDPARKDVQIVLLDHGMYRRIDPSVRRGNALLWSALALWDVRKGQHACHLLGLPSPALGILSQLLLTRRWGGAQADSWTQDDLHQRIKLLKLDNVNSILKMLPRDMLWVFRTLNILRCVTAHLSLPSWDRSAILVEEASAALALDRADATAAVCRDIRKELRSKYLQIAALPPAALTTRASPLFECSMIGPLATQSLGLRPYGRLCSRRQWVSETKTRGSLSTAASIFAYQVPWYLLSGAATLNLPVESEVEAKWPLHWGLATTRKLGVLLRRYLLRLKLKLLGTFSDAALDGFLPPVRFSEC